MQHTEEQVHVEDVTRQQDSDVEEEEDAHREVGSLTMTRKTRGKQIV
jgi:hypothetical protein